MIPNGLSTDRHGGGNSIDEDVAHNIALTTKRVERMATQCATSRKSSTFRLFNPKLPSTGWHGR